ncbi:hypothetical protein ACVRZD_02100 [Streptococcus hongkongensis]|nr:hypothetical protein NC01_02270 [Streptococcus uberis]
MLEVLLIITSLILFALLIISIIRNQLLASRRIGHHYLVRFDQVSKPIDLWTNRNVLENVKIISDHKEQGLYSVQSPLSDTKLKEILMSEYHLTLSQVMVSSLQLSP